MYSGYCKLVLCIVSMTCIDDMYRRYIDPIHDTYRIIYSITNIARPQLEQNMYNTTNLLYSDNDPHPKRCYSHRVLESTTSYIFPVQIGGSFTSPGIDTR